MYLVSVLTLCFSVAVFLATWLLTDWSAGLRIAVGVPTIALFSAVALPVSRGLWVAVEYATDVQTGETARAEYRARAYGKNGKRAGAGSCDLPMEGPRGPE